MKIQNVKNQLKLYQVSLFVGITLILIIPSFFLYINFDGNLCYFYSNNNFGDPGLFSWFFIDLITVFEKSSSAVFHQLVIVSFALKVILFLLLITLFLLLLIRLIKNNKKLLQNEIRADAINRKIFGSFILCSTLLIVLVMPIVWMILLTPSAIAMVIVNFIMMYKNNNDFNKEVSAVIETKKNKKVKELKDPKSLSNYLKEQSTDLDKYSKISNYLTMQQFYLKIKQFGKELPLKLLVPRKHSACRNKFMKKMESENIKISKIQLAVLDYLLQKVVKKQLLDHSPEEIHIDDSPEVKRQKLKFQKKYLEETYEFQISRHDLTDKFDEIDLSKTVNGLDQEILEEEDRINIPVEPIKKETKNKGKKKKTDDPLFNL